MLAWVIFVTSFALRSMAAETPVFPLEEHFQREYSLRSSGELEVSNARGDVQIEGWAQDKIRVKATRRATGSSAGEAKTLLSATDIRFQNVDKGVELAAEYGRGLQIEQRLQERQNPRTSMDMSVTGPARFPLRVWATNGKVAIHGWTGPVDVRTAKGPVHIESSRGAISVLCEDCAVSVHAVQASVRCMGGAGSIDLSDVRGPQIYVESDSGAVTVDGVEGEQLFVSKTGAIHGKNLKGRIEFHSREGSVDISNSSGFLSGRTVSGAIRASMKDWKFLDKAILESISGNVDLELPSSFAGEVELRSEQGNVHSEFPIESSQPTPVSGNISGRIGPHSGDENLLRMSSDRGSVSLTERHSD